MITKITDIMLHRTKQKYMYELSNFYKRLICLKQNSRIFWLNVVETLHFFAQTFT